MEIGVSQIRKMFDLVFSHLNWLIFAFSYNGLCALIRMCLVSNQNKLIRIDCKWLILFRMHEYINGSEFLFSLCLSTNLSTLSLNIVLKNYLVSVAKIKQTSFTLLYFTKRIYVLCLDYACFSRNIYHSINTLTSPIFIVFSLVVSDLSNLYFHIFHNGTHVSWVLVRDSINKCNFTFGISDISYHTSNFSSRTKLINSKFHAYG